MKYANLAENLLTEKEYRALNNGGVRQPVKQGKLIRGVFSYQEYLRRYVQYHNQTIFTNHAKKE